MVGPGERCTVAHGTFLLPVSAASQFTILCTFFAVVFTFYLIPLTISSPCIMEKKDLGPKPALIGHRGAPMVSTPRGWNEATAVAGEEHVGNKCHVCGSRCIASIEGLPGFGLICLRQAGV